MITRHEVEAKHVRPDLDAIRTNLADLVELPQWVTWYYHARDGERLGKVPRVPGSHCNASHSNPDTWRRFEVAAAAYQSEAGTSAGIRPGVAAGVGFVFHKRDNGPDTLVLVGVDIDKCRDPETGAIMESAWEKIKALNTYTEISPSGTGVKLLLYVRGGLPSAVKSSTIGIEMYDHARYFTITGRSVEGTPTTIEERTEAGLRLYIDLTRKEDRGVVNSAAEIEPHPTGLTDEQVLEKLFGEENGEKWRRVWRGIDGDYGGDDSAGDMALVQKLVFYSGDPEQVDRLFRDSHRYREKWDKVHHPTHPYKTYGEHTIWKAFVERTDFYGQNHAETAKDLDSVLDRIAEIARRATHANERNRAVYALAEHIAVLNGVERMQVRDALIDRLRWSKTDAEKFLDNAMREYGQENRKTLTTGPKYGEQDGRLVLYAGSTIPIADFTAQIVEQVTTEGGEQHYVVEGVAVRGGAFRAEISAKDFSDSRALKATLEAEAGPFDPVRAGFEKHLGAAIKTLTNPGEVKQAKLYRRTGWADGRFLIPGRESADVRIDLHASLPYRLDERADVEKGLEALDNLILSRPPEQSTVILALLFTAPAAKPAGWRDERYAVFAAGRTGSWKTEFSKHAMAIYGREFTNDSMITKFGQGATQNARIALAAQAVDMPFMVDNYKPNTGRGVNDLVNFLHAALEGREKDRMNRSGGALHEAKVLNCWPLITGEDVPDKESSTMARVLVVHFEKPEPGTPNPHLTRVQDLAEHLPAIGREWITWLETTEGRRVVATIAGRLSERRDAWSTYLARLRPDIQNANRLATNLASNELAWQMVCEHPRIGPVARKYTEAHRRGLYDVADAMANYTAEALEAAQFLAALRELLASKTVTLLPAGKEEYVIKFPGGQSAEHDPDYERMVGWQDRDGSTYLLVGKARQAVNRLLGGEGITVGNETLYKQLDELGYLAGKGSKTTISKRLGFDQEPKRVLHLVVSALSEEVEESTGGAARRAA